MNADLTLIRALLSELPSVEAIKSFPLSRQCHKCWAAGQCVRSDYPCEFFEKAWGSLLSQEALDIIEVRRLWEGGA